MNIAEAKEQIRDTVDAYLASDETGAQLIPPSMQRPLFLLGAPGIGKTAIVGQVAKELGIGLVSYSMTHHTRQSALGLPFIVHHDYEQGSFDVSEYTMSEIIASIFDYMEQTGHRRGILFLDEINCVSETLYPSMLQFLQFKTFGRHRVPDGWVVVCAGNPPEYNKSVYEFDVVTLDRLRKISIEPDLEAWIAYALQTGVHPAIISYLQIKNDNFYSVETTPSGKVFVTARGWDDLSRLMKLYEAKGKPVNKALMVQFLQDEDIAERFAQYYALFQKYRSDYQVGSILAGEAGPDIVERARAARFDERLALLRLILDALDSRFADVLEDERVVAGARDAIRARKDELLGGASVFDTIAADADALSSDADERARLDLATGIELRPQRRTATALRSYASACEQARTESGEAAFQTISAAYAADAEKLRENAQAASAQLDNAFSFVEDTFGEDREMNAFVAELTGREGTARFVGTFGNESYYRHNAATLAGGANDALLKRIGELDLSAAQVAASEARAAEQSAGCGSCGGGCC